MAASDAIVVASAARTPVGAFNGAFAAVPAHELGAAVITEVLGRAKVEPGEVDEVILGQVLTAAQGQNPARQASIKAGLPKETTAWLLNQVCGSGLRTIAVGMQQIATGDAKVIVAGGQESMSMSPHAAHLRNGVKMGDYAMIDTMIRDGLWDAFNGYHMGTTAPAPSLMPEALAAVTVPSLSKAGFSFCIASMVAPWRIYSSWSTTTSPLRVFTVYGTISSLKRPAFCAASALFCEASANWS